MIQTIQENLDPTPIVADTMAYEGALICIEDEGTCQDVKNSCTVAQICAGAEPEEITLPSIRIMSNAEGNANRVICPDEAVQSACYVPDDTIKGEPSKTVVFPIDIGDGSGLNFACIQYYHDANEIEVTATELEDLNKRCTGRLKIN